MALPDLGRLALHPVAPTDADAESEGERNSDSAPTDAESEGEGSPAPASALSEAEKTKVDNLLNTLWWPYSHEPPFSIGYLAVVEAIMALKPYAENDRGIRARMIENLVARLTNGVGEDTDFALEYQEQFDDAIEYLKGATDLLYEQRAEVVRWLIQEMLNDTGSSRDVVDYYPCTRWYTSQLEAINDLLPECASELRSEYLKRMHDIVVQYLDENLDSGNQEEYSGYLNYKAYAVDEGMTRLLRERRFLDASLEDQLDALKARANAALAAYVVRGDQDGDDFPLHIN